jgi:hypothetical protein
VTRSISVLMLAVASAFACDASRDGDGDDTAEEAVRAVERAQRQAARKVEQAGEALREKTADGSLLVQSPMAADGGD